MKATLYCGARASHCSGFSYCREPALGARASVVAALKSVVKEHGLRCSLRVNLPEPGIEATFPEPASRFISTIFVF